MSGFNIQDIDFNKVSDSFKVNIDIDNFAPKTINALKNGDKPVDLSDKTMDKQDAENFYVELDANQDFTIDDDEITAYANNKGIAGKESEIKELVNTTLEAIREQTKSTEESAEEEKAKEDIKVSVQTWGSAPADGNKYANDCLGHIMLNNYPDLEPNSEEWNAKELEIMNANPDIYGTVDDEGNVTGARKSVGGEGRHNAVLYDTDEIILPGISTAEISETDKTTETGETDETETDETEEAKGETVAREDGTTNTVYKNDNGLIEKSEHKNADGILLDITEYKYDDNSVKTQETQTKFDTDGKKTEQTAYTYLEDGITILKENTYKYIDSFDTRIPVTEKIYNSDRTYQSREYKDNGCSILATYNADGTIQNGTEKYYDDMGNEITKEQYEQ